MIKCKNVIVYTVPSGQSIQNNIFKQYFTLRFTYNKHAKCMGL